MDSATGCAEQTAYLRSCRCIVMTRSFSSPIEFFFFLRQSPRKHACVCVCFFLFVSRQTIINSKMTPALFPSQSQPIFMILSCLMFHHCQRSSLTIERQTFNILCHSSYGNNCLPLIQSTELPEASLIFTACVRDEKRAAGVCRALLSLQLQIENSLIGLCVELLLLLLTCCVQYKTDFVRKATSGDFILITE